MKQRGFSIVGTLVYAAIIFVLYAIIVGYPVIKDRYAIRELLMAKTNRAYYVKNDSLLRNEIFHAFKDRSILIDPGQIWITRTKKPETVTVRVSYRREVDFLFQKKWIEFTQSYTGDMTPVDWKKEQEKGVF